MSGAGVIKMRTEIEEEYGYKIPALRVSEEEMRACFAAYDLDGSGYIDHNQFSAALQGGAVGTSGGQQETSSGSNSRAAAQSSGAVMEADASVWGGLASEEEDRGESDGPSLW